MTDEDNIAVVGGLVGTKYRPFKSAEELMEAMKEHGECEPDAFDEDMILPMREGYIVSRIRGGFKAGAEYGYKEAVERAKEWLFGYIRSNSNDLSAYEAEPAFEAYMNKLWEEEK